MRKEIKLLAVEVSPEDHKRLKRFAVEKEVSMASLLRPLIQQLLDSLDGAASLQTKEVPYTDTAL